MAIKKSKKNLKIIGATSMALFSLVSVFVATIAWFALNNSVGASGMAIKALDDGLKFSQVKIFKSIPNRCTNEILIFDTTPASTISDNANPTNSLTLDDYSEFNKRQPILLLFELAAPSQAVITAQTNTSSFGQAATSSNQNSYPMSNAIYFRSTTSYTLSDGYYQVSQLNNSSQFVNFTNNNPSWSQSLIVYDSGSSIVNSSIAVVIDYFEEAVEYLRENCLTSEINKLIFSCDWTMKIS